MTRPCPWFTPPGQARPVRFRLETITLQRPRCPRCGGIVLRKYRSIANQGDGSSVWWVRCGGRECEHRFRVVLE